MKTVPSLVATSTVGIAAAGLALGKPERSTPRRPSSKKRKATDIEHNPNRSSISPNSRPATSSTVITPDRPVGSAYGSSSAATGPSVGIPRVSSTIFEDQASGTVRRVSGGRLEELSSPQEYVADEARESISSRGSWMRRLSTIQLSQNNSPRSSLGPDSPSFSNSSAAPILSNDGSSPAPLPPNKLVKRTTSGKTNGGARARSGTSPQLPTLRRPATSHQRSFTLQQQLKRENSTSTKDQAFPDPLPSQNTQNNSYGKTKHAGLDVSSAWRPFFEARPTKLSKERSSGRSSDGSMQKSLSTSKRVVPDELVRPSLIKPAMITMSKSTGESYYDEETLPFEEEEADDDVDEVVEESVVPTTEAVESQKRLRRSLSINFSSPSTWISRSSSLRGHKRNSDVKAGTGGKRYSSAPVSTIPGRDIASAHAHSTNGHRAILDPTVFQKQAPAPVVSIDPNDPFSLTSLQTRSRNSSSPLPPLSRLSSFNVDLARLGLSSSSSSAPLSPNLHVNPTAASISSGRMSPSSASYFTTLNVKGPRTSELTDRASTLIGSDNDVKGFSGDEDDTDFQSETVYDSLRTATTGSMRSHNTQLESMFDESPPSVSSHSKKRLSIHEMLGNGSFGEGNKIDEEDEGMPTPVKGNRSRTSHEEGFRTPVHRPVDADEPVPSSPPNFCLASKDFSGLSLDDGPEEEEDWNKDDENAEFGSPLSPPSHPSSSINSRRVDASFRAALADVTHSNSPNGKFNQHTERPRSNLFDWSEPSTIEKPDLMGNSPRPSTAYAKHVLDGRGGRAVGRRGPSALHIRSQSVPVVPDLANQRETSKAAQKFGTWGLGAKGVSEDWDGDFEFESAESDDADDGESKLENSGMFVPEAIQASQASVVGHVGQIREVCLLVEDLKRLRILGREKNLLNGTSAPLWKEAEGIIALAVPDEEDLALSPPQSPLPKDPDTESIDEKYTDHGLDGEELSQADEPFDVLNQNGRPTGYSYDGSHVRRRSVFSPEDDIFGAGAILNEPDVQRPKPVSRATSPVIRSSKNSTDVARSVMETIHQHRSTSDPLLRDVAAQSLTKMPFDTTSLRDLVHRASTLSRTLADIIRRADGMSPSPEVSPHRDSSPAFTRVFTDPMASPPKHLPRSQSNNSVLGGSIDSSPSRSLGQRMHMMTVV